MPVAQLHSYLQVACFLGYHMNWRLHTSASQFRIVSKFPFPLMLFGFVAQGEDVCKLLGGWPRTDGIELGLLGKC